MRTLFPICAVAFSLVAGAALAVPCDEPEEMTWALTTTEESVEGKEVLARTAYSCGHFWSSANLMERALAENGNALERFNLAATYARTGRYDAAMILYESVVADGDFINARMDIAFLEAADVAQGFNLADEARRRLVALSYVRRLAQWGADRTLAENRSALDFGTNVSDMERPAATKGSGLSASRVLQSATISDVQAMAMDGLLAPLPR